ncbi:MAG: T9SS type A sorting domain-containing protein [Flavobacteriales bacterium]|nr:T9SS type A sorting domain-containing protein [Flavobacteriales bacterium]
MKNYVLALFTVIPSLLFSQTITTIAGTGLSTYNGDGLSATATNLGNVGIMTFNNNGELLFPDSSKNLIRKVHTNGVITTIAGTQSSGYNGENILAINADLYTPNAVVVDGFGNIFFSELGNCRVRKIDTNGIITTIAGNGECVSSGDFGLAVQARIRYPQSISIDSGGNIYICESVTHKVRKIDTSGIITTIAGTGIAGYNGDGILATNAQISQPGGVVVDPQGNIFFSEHFGQRIRKIDTNGIISTVAGTGIAGFNGNNIQANTAQINRPTGIRIDAQGNLYFADSYNNRIRKINTNGVITTIAGMGLQGYTGDGGSALSAMLNTPSDLLFALDGSMYISDNFNYRIRKVTNVLGNEDFTISEGDVALAPNPSANGYTTVYFPELVDEIKVYDLLGQIVLSENAQGKDHIEIYLPNSGVYLVTFYSAGATITKKLVVGQN